jgi:hypothetical protein
MGWRGGIEVSKEPEESYVMSACGSSGYQVL